MEEKDYLSVKDFADETGYTTNHVYELGKSGTIAIEMVAGFKVIDKIKYPPKEYMKTPKT